MQDTFLTEVTEYRAADDDHCGVSVAHDGQAYVLTGIETGERIARTGSTTAAVAHAAAYLISYAYDGTRDGDGDWSATERQGRAMLAELDGEADGLAAAL